jgi:hypothetical protein
VRVKDARGDTSQAAFCLRRGKPKLTIDRLQQAETKDLATMDTLKAICRAAQSGERKFTPEDFLKNQPIKTGKT